MAVVMNIDVCGRGSDTIEDIIFETLGGFSAIGIETTGIGTFYSELGALNQHLTGS